MCLFETWLDIFFCPNAGFLNCARNLLNNINQLWHYPIEVYLIFDIFCNNGNALFKCISDNTTEKLSQNTKGIDYVNQRFSNGFRKIVVCENCLYYGSISEFYNAHRYCLECLCDHACCPVCKIGYHAINISEWMIYHSYSTLE